jgi:hypothetical protein
MVELGVTIYDSLLLAFLVFRAIETKIAVEFLNKTVFLILIVFFLTFTPFNSIYILAIKIVLIGMIIKYFVKYRGQVLSRKIIYYFSLSLLMYFLFIFISSNYIGVITFLGNGFDNQGHFGQSYAALDLGRNLFGQNQSDVKYLTSLYPGASYPPLTHSAIFFIYNFFGIEFGQINKAIPIYFIFSFLLYLAPALFIFLKRRSLKSLIFAFVMLIFLVIGNSSHIFVSGFVPYFLSILLIIIFYEILENKELKIYNFVPIVVIFLIAFTIPAMVPYLVVPYVFIVTRKFYSNSNYRRHFITIAFLFAISISIFLFGLMTIIETVEVYLALFSETRYFIGLEPVNILFSVFLYLAFFLIITSKYKLRDASPKLAIGLSIILINLLSIIVSYAYSNMVTYYFAKNIYVTNIILFYIILDRIIELKLNYYKDYFISSSIIIILVWSTSLGLKPRVWTSSYMGSLYNVVKTLRNHQLELVPIYGKTLIIMKSAVTSQNGKIGVVLSPYGVDLQSRWLNIVSGTYNDNTWKYFKGYSDESVLDSILKMDPKEVVLIFEDYEPSEKVKLIVSENQITFLVVNR